MWELMLYKCVGAVQSTVLAGAGLLVTKFHMAVIFHHIDVKLGTCGFTGSIRLFW